jgi:hypothetical protein
VGGVEKELHGFLTLALNRGEWLGSCTSRFTQVERAHCTHGIGGWLALSATPDVITKRKFCDPAGTAHTSLEISMTLSELVLLLWLEHIFLPLCYKPPSPHSGCGYGHRN